MSEELESRAFAQWVEVEIFAVNMNVTIKFVNLRYGNFHNPGNKHQKINASSIENHVIEDGTSYIIASSGKNNSSSGTEGRFFMYHDESFLGEYKWDCPWGKKTNTDNLRTTDNKNYRLDKTHGNYHGGALGNIKITCAKIK